MIGPALHVRDLQRVLRFYVDDLGMAVALQMGPPDRFETILTFGGDPRGPGIILLSGASADAAPPMEVGGYDRTVIRTQDIEAMHRRLTDSEFAASEIRDVAYGYRMMLATDPEGYRYEIVKAATN